MKKILCGIIAAAMSISMAALPAFAADYGKDPGYTADNPVEVVDKDIIANAADNGGEIYVKNNSAVLDNTALSALANATVPVSFVFTEYTVTIDPSTISDDASKLDISLAIKDKTEISNVKIPDNSLVVAPSADGDFGLAMEIKLPVSFDNGTKLNIYHITNSGAVSLYKTVTVSNGNVDFTITGSSEYVITDETMTITSGNGGSEEKPSDNSGNPATGVELPAAMLTVGLVSAGIITVCRKHK